MGLASAAAALLGDDIEATLDALAGGHGEAWPWLPGLCFKALEPLGVEFPEHNRHAVAIGKVLVGRPVRREEVTVGLRRLRRRTPPAPRRAPSPELAAAVDAFWEQLTPVAAELGRARRRGDADGPRRALEKARSELRERARQVRRAVRELEAGASPPGASPPAASTTAGDASKRSGPAPPRRRAPSVTTSASAPAPAGPPAADGRERGSNPAREAPPAAERDSRPPRKPTSTPGAPVAEAGGTSSRPDAPPHSDDELGTDRPYAALLFAAAAVGLALLLLLAVAVGLPLA